MNTVKKITAFLLCVLLCLSCFLTAPAAIKADAAGTTAKLEALKKKFPDGKYWNHVGSTKNNPDGYTSTPCTHHGYKGSGCIIAEGGCECNYFNGGIQCAGYSYKLAYEITGSLASESNGWTKSTSLDASKLCVGDIIRYLNNTHSIVVVGVSGTTIAYTGANWGANCLIKWSTMDVSQITGFSFVYHKTSNSTKSTDVKFVSNETEEIWKTKSSNDASVNIRKSASTSASIVGSIPPGKKFTVLSKSYSTTTKYLWAKVKYDSITGWSVLNWAEYVSGSIETLEFINLGDLYSGVAATLNWKAIDGADNYMVYIYNSAGTLTKTYTAYSTEKKITISSPGEYYIRLVAKNSQVSSWSVDSGRLPVEVISSAKLKMTDVALPTSMNIPVGSSAICDFDITPVSATADMSWSSSKTAVASVNAQGKITAKSCGTAVITCKSKANASISAKCSITVTPTKVVSLAQNAAGSSTSAIKFTWKAQSGVDGYRVYTVAANGTKTKLADVTTASYTFKELKAGTSKKIAVRAFCKLNGSTVWGAYSSALTGYVKPSKVSNLKCTEQTTSGFKLTWAGVKNATAYQIYYYNSSSKKWVKLAETSAKSYSIAGKAGQTLKYKVRAVIKKTGVSLTGAYSAEIFGFRAPAKPKVTSTVANTSVTLKWSKVSGATGYKIYIKKGDTFKLLKTVNSSTLSFKAAGLSRKTNYVFRVFAVATHGSQTKNSGGTEVKAKTS